ncbi:hypothetical protein HK405_007854 [Cladochytrium tenue]|nr:hypothetical protein HK405_007854 [Cladochytrium tenue]
MPSNQPDVKLSPQDPTAMSQPLVKNSLEPFLSGRGPHPSAPTAFSPVKVGNMTLSHRIVMAPMTRSRSPGLVPNAMNALYYAQRATCGGLIITEATPASATGWGYADVPGLRTEEQAAGWRVVTDAVHDKGGFMFAQLWHVGRVSISKFQPDGAAPVSASETALVSSRADPGAKARALTVAEIKGIAAEFKESARLSHAVANFDGIEVHAAHGYLIDQFLHSNANLRSDEYGGSVENRARFLFEVLDAVLTELPSTRVAVRLSPWSTLHDMADTDTEALFTHVLKRISKYGLAYVHFTEPDNSHPSGAAVKTDQANGDSTRATFWGDSSRLNKLVPLVELPTKVLLTGDYRLPEAEHALTIGRAHIIGMGRPFIPTPDLVLRLWNGQPIKTDSPVDFFFSSGPKGYVDYPTYLEEKSQDHTAKARDE